MTYDDKEFLSSGYDDRDFEDEYFASESGYDWGDSATEESDLYGPESAGGGDYWSDYRPTPPRRQQTPPWTWILVAAGGLLAVIIIAGLALFLTQRPEQDPGLADIPPTLVSHLAATPTIDVGTSGSGSPSPATVSEANPTAAPPMSPGTAQMVHPSPTAAPIPISGEKQVATYDTDGTLLGVTDGDGQPVGDQFVLEGFPVTMGRGISRIPLSAVAHDVAGLTRLDGATFDEASGQIVLIGRSDPDSPTLDPDDLLVALSSVYGGQDPGVSIDPGPTRDEMLVRYIGPTEQTHFGEVMFEADRLLKTLSFGQDNLTDEPVTSRVPGFQTELDLVADLHEFGELEEAWHRFWYVADQMQVRVNDDGRSMSFDEASLTVNTEYLGQDFQPVPNHPPDPAAQTFADHFSDHYARFAEEQPVLRELIELAKFVSLAKWTQDFQIPVDIGWLGEQPVTYVDTPVTTRAITVTRTLTEPTTGGHTIWTISLYGGVDFGFENEYVTGGPALGFEAMEVRPSDSTSSWEFVSPRDGAEYRAVAVSTTPVERIGSHRIRALADVGLSPVGQLGPPLARTYDSMATEPSEFGYGWALTLSRLTFPLPKGSFTASGDAERAYDLYPEIVVRDDQGGTVRYVLSMMGEDGTIFYQAKTLPGQQDLTLNPDGTYRLATPDSTLSFDAGGKLVQAQDGAGNWVNYRYDGETLRRTEDSVGQWAELGYEDGRVAQVTASSGETVRYAYDQAGDLIEVLYGEDRSLAFYAYDNSHRLILELDGQGGFVRSNTYDALGRRIAWEDGSGEFTVDFADEGAMITRVGSDIYAAGPIRSDPPPGPETVLDPGEQALVDEAGSEYKYDVQAYHQLRTHPSIRQLGDQIGEVNTIYLVPEDRGYLALVDGVEVTLGREHSVDADAVKAELQSRGLVAGTGPLIATGRGSHELNLRAVFPDRVVLQAEGLEPEMIVRNAESVCTDGPITPNNTVVFNAVPQNAEELSRSGLDSRDAPVWEKIHREIEEVFRNAGYSSRTTAQGSMADQITRALQEQDNTLIVVAHSDGDRIYLRDGTILDPSQLDDEAKAAIQRNRPNVILLSCETSKISKVRSFAKKLVDLGAKVVIAPDVRIGAANAHKLLENLLHFSAQGLNPVQAMSEAIESLRGSEFFDATYDRFKNIIGRLAIPGGHRQTGFPGTGRGEGV